MKKYLVTGLAAVAISGMFTSCTHENDTAGGSSNLGVVETYEKAFISRLRFYVSAENLATFTKYHGFDPENHGNTGKEDTRKAQNSPSGTGSSSQEDGNESPDDVVFQKVRELIAEYAPGLRPEDIKPDDSLKELCHKGRSASVVIGLGYDEPSLLLLDLGKKLGITFPSLWAQIAGNARIATVRDAVEYIKSHQPRQPGSGCTDS